MANEVPLSFFPALSHANMVIENDPISRIFTEAIRIIRTKKGSHFEDPEFGTNIHTFISVLDNPSIGDQIKEDIQSALDLYLPEFSFAITLTVKKENYISFLYKITMEIENTTTSVVFNTKSGNVVV